jgi:hypothetical protein
MSAKFIVASVCVHLEKWVDSDPALVYATAPHHIARLKALPPFIPGVKSPEKKEMTIGAIAECGVRCHFS